MTRKLSSNGFTVVEVVIALLVVAALSLGGLFVWQRTHKDEPTKTSTTKTVQADKKDTSKDDDTKATDPSEGGKYLYVKEWSVRAALPSDLQGKVTYALGESLTDSDGNQILAAKISLKNEHPAENDCAVASTAAGDFIDSAAQLLRVEKGKPFDTARYHSTLKANLLTDDSHVYHLNYLTPDCAGPQAAEQIGELQSALVHLERVQ